MGMSGCRLGRGARCGTRAPLSRRLEVSLGLATGLRAKRAHLLRAHLRGVSQGRGVRHRGRAGGSVGTSAASRKVNGRWNEPTSGPRSRTKTYGEFNSRIEGSISTEKITRAERFYFGPKCVTTSHHNTQFREESPVATRAHWKARGKLARPSIRGGRVRRVRDGDLTRGGDTSARRRGSRPCDGFRRASRLLLPGRRPGAVGTEPRPEPPRRRLGEAARHPRNHAIGVRRGDHGASTSPSLAPSAVRAARSPSSRRPAIHPPFGDIRRATLRRSPDARSSPPPSPPPSRPRPPRRSS